MKKNIMLFAATIICGVCFLTSCSKDDSDLNVAEKIIGKWMPSEIDGEAVPTNDKSVYTFVSATQAYMSVSINPRQDENAVWNNRAELDVVIDGNKMTLTYNLDEHTTMVEEFDVTAINANEFTANHKITVSIDGTEAINNQGVIRFTKVNDDYTQTIVGTWEGRCTSEGSVFDDGQDHRWEYRANGDYEYYRNDGGEWIPYGDDFSQYFVDGNLLCTRWGSNGQENREWWEISIDGNTMHWTALREDENGQRYTATFEMTKVQ